MNVEALAALTFALVILFICAIVLFNVKQTVATLVGIVLLMACVILGFAGYKVEMHERSRFALLQDAEIPLLSPHVELVGTYEQKPRSPSGWAVPLLVALSTRTCGCRACVSRPSLTST